jgi:molybdopterin-containing oxidoreductase family iron-sulfur binding subunit
MEATRQLDLERIRSKVSHQTGPRFWRSLEELAETEEFQAFLQAEFPRQAAEWTDPVGRRQFLKLMGASLALAGLTACTKQPAEKIFPYVKAPEHVVPGEPLFFATAMPLAGVGTGLLVESHLGRPTKVEGNPLHPSSLGATDAFAQASVLTLYDPDRSQVLRYVGEIRPWSVFVDAMQEMVAAQREKKGAGLRILTETVTSPTLARQLRELRAELPEIRWHQYEAAGRDSARVGALLAYGEYVETHYRFDRADIVLSLDADFLSCGVAHLRYVRDFMSKRRLRAPRSEMNRLYVVEPMPSNTGAVADHRLPLRAGEVEDFARALAAEIGVPVRTPAGVELHRSWVKTVAADLKHHRGKSIVVAGDQQPPAVHAIAHALNEALENVGKTVVHTEPIEPEPTDQLRSLRDLSEAMEAGRVDVLLILGGNPVLSAPADLKFGERLRKVPLRVHLSLYDDETSELCHWHVPEAHFLETWGDIRAFDGTVTVMQPLIAPLYDGKSAVELLATLTDRPGQRGYELVRETWSGRYTVQAFEGFWAKILHDGLIPGTAFRERRVSLRADWDSQAKPSGNRSAGSAEEKRSASLEITYRLDPTIFDGRFANNAWLQELPKPITKLTWDNAAFVSPRTAERLGVTNEELVELHRADRAVTAPIWIVPGQAVDSVTVHLGYGRTRAGSVGNGTGFNAYVLRTSDEPWFAEGLEVRKAGGRRPLACTQHHHSMEGRDLIRRATLSHYRSHPDFARHGAHNGSGGASLHPPHPYEGYAWGMSIDLNACVGCNACVVACQAENNIPVVGKTEVLVGREMHWLRIDRYFEGDLDKPLIYHQPVPCMHCERAPCEVVCPVNATVHSNEGLNDMVYNRCVGTRYCSNNCPYKVRRFNFRLYSNWHTETLKMLANPDVTVRSRGVMEKCTYCVQRINYARIQAKREDRKIRDGEVVTACQAACPAEAILFGDINDPKSRIAEAKKDPRDYALLEEIGTVPRTTYLAAVRNPNPGLG